VYRLFLAEKICNFICMKKKKHLSSQYIIASKGISLYSFAHQKHLHEIFRWKNIHNVRIFELALIKTTFHE